MDAMMPDPSMLAMKSKDSEWLQKEMEMRRLQKELGSSQTKEQELHEATKGFESIFINKLWQQMRKTVPKEGYLHGKNEEMYLSMFDQALAEKLADAGGIGLGDMLYEQLKQSMEDASRVTSPSAAEDKKPIKELTAKYDPRILNPSEEHIAANQAKTETAEAEPRDNTPITGLYDSLDGGENSLRDNSDPDAESGQGAAEEPQLSGWDDDPFVAEEDTLENQSMVQQVAAEDGPELLLEAQDPGAFVPHTPEAVAKAREDAAFIQADPEIMTAVDMLARRIAPNASPVKMDQGTRLAPPAAAAGGIEPASVEFPSGNDQQVSLLEGGIKRKQGAMENEGGHQPLREVPGLQDASESLSRLQFSQSPASGISSLAARWGASAAFEAADAAPVEPLHWPVEGRMTSEHGWRRSPFTGERTFHEGIDLAAREGSPVAACWGGEVSFVGHKSGYGKVVVLDHPGGWQSVYAHNGSFSAEQGQSVKAGEKIATVGNTGRSTGPHVHFEVRHQGASFDPMKIQNSLVAGRPIGHEA